MNKNIQKNRHQQYLSYRYGYPYDNKQYDGRGNLVKIKASKKTYRDNIFK